MILSPGYELQWQRAPGAEACIEARELGAAVGARVGREVFAGAEAAALVIDGEVRPAADGWHVAIAIRDRAGAARGGRELDIATEFRLTASRRGAPPDAVRRFSRAIMGGYDP